MAKHRHGRSSRYSAYTGGPDPLAPPVDLREALEQIGQDVMEGSSPRRALSELMRRGTRNMRGADRLAAEANRRRPELLQYSEATSGRASSLLIEKTVADRPTPLMTSWLRVLPSDLWLTRRIRRVPATLAADHTAHAEVATLALA